MSIFFFRRHPFSSQFLRSLFSDLCSLCVNLFSFSSLRFTAVSALACLFLFAAIPPASAQDIDKPLQSIDEDVTAFAYAPDGRIVYSVRRLFKTKKYDLQHDDIWLLESSGKRKRLLQGEKFTLGNNPFSYTVDGFCWSPNGRMILAELYTMSIADDSGKTQDERLLIVFGDNGKEVRLGNSDNVIHDSAHAMWLLDNSTIVHLTEALKPNILFSFKFASVASRSSGLLFDGRTFLAYDSLPGANAAIAIERDRSLSGPPRIQRLDLLQQDNQELATLDNYETGLSVSPSGKRVAYYIDKEVLEIRDLAHPVKIARVRAGLGAFRWAPDESALLLKRAPDRKSGDLVWVPIPPLSVPASGHAVPVSEPAFVPLLHGLSFRDFAISPDGRHLAVVPPGKRSVLVFPLPPR